MDFIKTFRIIVRKINLFIMVTAVTVFIKTACHLLYGYSFDQIDSDTFKWFNFILFV